MSIARQATPPVAPGLPRGAALHPWNRDFAWRSPAGPIRALTARQADQFHRDGYAVLEGVLDPEEVAAAVAEIDPIDRETEAFLQTRPDGRFMILESGAITFSVHLVARSERLAALAAHPVFTDLCRDLVGDDANLYWDQAVYKKPEKPRRFPWHQDNGYTYVEPQQYLTCWVALTDASEANGCPWVVPGLHRRGTLRHWMTDLGWRCLEQAPGAVPVPARAGSIVVFSSLTPHRTGPNLSDGVRKAYIVQFAPDGARTVKLDGDARHYETCDDPARQFLIT